MPPRWACTRDSETLTVPDQFLRPATDALVQSLQGSGGRLWGEVGEKDYITHNLIYIRYQSNTCHMPSVALRRLATGPVGGRATDALSQAGRKQGMDGRTAARARWRPLARCRNPVSLSGEWVRDGFAIAHTAGVLVWGQHHQTVRQSYECEPWEGGSASRIPETCVRGMVTGQRAPATRGGCATRDPKADIKQSRARSTSAREALVYLEGKRTGVPTGWPHHCAPTSSKVDAYM